MNEAPKAGVLQVSVRGIGVLGPGLSDWTAAQAALRDPSLWQRTATVLPAPARLPPAERRRAGAIVKLSLAVADQACEQAGIDPSSLATVFSASTGDAANCHALCEALAQPERLVSPTRFTNSVHNASAGYWHIATSSRAPSTSLCAHDASFGAGLLEAASQCVSLDRPVLLVAGDVPYPQPLQATRPLPDAMAVAMVLDPAAGGVASLRLQLSEGPADPLDDAGLEELRRQIPAARALPLLRLLAQQRAGQVCVEASEGLGVNVEVSA